MQIFHTADELIAHLRFLASTPSVEDTRLTELDHGLQCAALLQQRHPEDLELQIAGLIHDLAHPWDEPGQPRHAAMGAKAVRTQLGDRVAELIAGHVAAKRYLVTVDPDYRRRLSPDSVATLAAQGGNLSPTQVEGFRAQPYSEMVIELRRADDDAKVVGAVVPGLDQWLGVVTALWRGGPAASPV